MKSLREKLLRRYRFFWAVGAFCTTGSVLPLVLGLLPTDKTPNCALVIGWCVAIVVPILGYWFSIRSSVSRQQYVSHEVLR